MLLPDQRVGCDRIERGMILGAQRPQLDQFSHQRRLKLE
jgi:hypothetical protein